MMITRRAALSILSTLPAAPFIARLAAQTRRATRRIYMGRSLVLMLEPDGTMKVWSILGTQPSGELGLGHNKDVEIYRAYALPGLKNVVAAAAGLDVSFAVLADGTVMSWGTHSSGICGITPLSFLEEFAFAKPDVYTPTPVVVPFDAVDISCTSTHALALTRDGGVYAWGEGKNGRLGIGPLPVINFRTHKPAAMGYVPFPVRIPDLTGVAAVSAGGDHSLALLKDGSVRAWGANKDGQLGDGTTVDRDRPVPVQGIRTAVSIAAGYSQFSAAALADGTVMTWGNNGAGSLGRPPWYGDDHSPHPIPTLVPGVRGARAVVAGNGQVLALTEAGTVISWGYNAHGQLGQGDSSGQSPKVIAGLTGVHAVFAALETSYAVLDDGRIMVWGAVREWNRPGKGSREVSPSPIPLKIDGLENP